MAGSLKKKIEESNKKEEEKSKSLQFDLSDEMLKNAMALQESELTRLQAFSEDRAQRFQAVLDTIDDGMISIDQLGRIENVNLATLKIFGYRKEEVTGKRFSVLLDLENYKKFNRYAKDYLTANDAEKTQLNCWELMVLHSSGRKFPVSVTVTETEVANKRIFIGIIRNLTEHQLAKQHAVNIDMRLRAIIGTIPDAIISIDSTGIIESINSSTLLLFGYTEAEVVGQNVSILMPRGHAIHHDNYIANYIATGKGKIIGEPPRELNAVRKDGSVFPIELHVSEMKIDDQRMFLGIIRDITAKKQAEQARESASQKLASAIEALPGGFALYDSQDKLILYNEAHKNFYKTSSNVIKDGAYFNDIIKHGLECKQYKDAIEQEEEWYKERLYHHRNPSDAMIQELDDGRWVSVLEHNTNEGGIVSFQFDITELKKKEKALRENDARLRAVIDAVLEAIVLVDLNLRVVEVSQIAQTMFGLNEAEMVGKFFYDIFIAPENRDDFKQCVVDFSEGRHCDFVGKPKEITAIHADGKEFPIEVYLVPDSEEEFSHYVLSMRDITEQKMVESVLIEAKEAAESANAAQSNFLAMMSHEIRTPLNGVLGILSLLQDSPLNETQHQLVQTGNESSQSLLRIINDILDFSKIEAGHIDLEAIDFNVKAMIKGVVELLSPRAQEKGLSFLTRIADCPSQYLHGDVERIRQVLINLLGNAVKFTEDGFINVSVSFSGEVTDEYIKMHVRVADTGIGIPENKLSIVFTRFKTVDPSYQRKEGGTGLGLAISQQIVAAMNGEIGVVRNDFGGTTFWFEIPLKPRDQIVQGEENDEKKTTFPLINGRKPRILMAEDNPTNAMVVKMMLKDVCSDVDLANNGQEAVKNVQSAHYDMILMDIGMPVMDGTAATHEIRQLPGDVSHIPIVAFTAHVMKNNNMDSMLEGMDGYITKPVKKDDLLSAIAKILEKHTLAIGGELSEQHIERHQNLDMAPVQSEKTQNTDDANIGQALENAVSNTMNEIGQTVSEVEQLTPDNNTHNMGENNSGQTQSIAEVDISASEVQNPPVIEQNNLSSELHSESVTEDPISQKNENNTQQQTPNASSGAATQSGGEGYMSNEVLLNEDMLKQLREDTGDEVLPILIDDFIVNSRDRYNNIASAMQAQNISDLEHHAHALCSSSAMFGANRLHQLVVEIEDLCKAGQRDKAIQLAGYVANLGNETETALKAYLQIQ